MGCVGTGEGLLRNPWCSFQLAVTVCSLPGVDLPDSLSGGWIESSGVGVNGLIWAS